MATKKITDLVELTSAASGDVLPIVDISEDVTKKIQVINFPISTATQTALDAKISTYYGVTYDVTALAAVSQAEYDAIGTKSATTLYFII